MVNVNAAQNNLIKSAIIQMSKNMNQNDEETKQVIRLTTPEEGDYAGVSLNVSDEALKLFQQQLESTKEQEDSDDDMAKMMEIARRIAQGGKVPPLDEKKLMEYSSEMYQMAKQAAMMSQNKEHKQYESLFEDEENGDMTAKINALSNGGVDVAVSGETSVSVATE